WAESAETSSARIRRATASATALLPLAVGPKSPRTAGSDCCSDELGTAERRRGGAADLDGDERPGARSPGEVHGRVPARAAAAARGSGAARPLAQPFPPTPEPLGVPAGRRRLDDLDQALDPVALDPLGYLPGQPGCLGAAARREDEGEGTV